jgi:hypothetical protein
MKDRATWDSPVNSAPIETDLGTKAESAGALSAQYGQLMLKSDKLEFERGAL